MLFAAVLLVFRKSKDQNNELKEAKELCRPEGGKQQSGGNSLLARRCE